MEQSFWHTLAKPIIGLAPMDGVTDPAMRATIDTVASPSVMYTEFVSSEGLSRGIFRLLRTFVRHVSVTPLVGQLFGATPDSVYISSLILCELGVSGIDINMGCPNSHITKSGGGAALINDPILAKKIIKTAQKAVSDWQNGKRPDLPAQFVKEMRNISPAHDHRSCIPISVKTRIGYDKPDTEHWISELLDAYPDTIVLHGRTLKQMYSGLADWQEIRKASLLASDTNTLLVGNGDISSFEMAHEYAKTFSPDGVMIGRAACGNPWIFSGDIPSYENRRQTALLHIRYFRQLTPGCNPLSLRKHLAWYFKNFPEASDIRSQIINTSDLDAFELYISSLPIKW